MNTITLATLTVGQTVAVAIAGGFIRRGVVRSFGASLDGRVRTSAYLDMLDGDSDRFSGARLTVWDVDPAHTIV